MIAAQEASLAKLMEENQYYRNEGLLKSEAIENLEKIVDELMRKNNYQKNNMDAIITDTQAMNM